MFEKVNPSHPDKVADRIAGALVDLAYSQNGYNPKIAVEVLIGHGKCHIIAETSEKLDIEEVSKAVKRISGIDDVDYVEVPQDEHLSQNQAVSFRCGDNGIFKGVPVNDEERKLSKIVKDLYKEIPFDGKFIINDDKLIMCQSHCKSEVLKALYPGAIVNPLGDWTGGTDVDTGATNRKLGSDMGRSVTGGGLHGKDLSKADVSVNIYAFIKAQITGEEVEIHCAIGDKIIDGITYDEIVEIAKKYILGVGGFEKFAEYGLI